jgi:hypothetical protein
MFFYVFSAITMRLATALWTGLELVRIGWKLRRR